MQRFYLTLFVILSFEYQNTAALQKSLLGIEGSDLILNCDNVLDNANQCTWSYEGKSVDLFLDRNNSLQISQWENVNFDNHCDIHVKSLSKYHHQGTWTCYSLDKWGQQSSPSNTLVNVIKYPILTFIDETYNIHDQKFKLGESHKLKCKTNLRIQDHSIKIDVTVLQEDKLSRSIPLLDDFYNYKIGIKDSKLRCLALVRNTKSGEIVYQEVQEIEINQVTFEPILDILNEQVLACSNPPPQNVYYNYSNNAKPEHLKLDVISKYCFKILEPPVELLANLEAHEVKLISEESNIDFVIVAPESVKRTDDFTVIFKILLPSVGFGVFLGVIFLYLALKKKWCCFQKNSLTLDKEKTISTNVSEDSSCPPSPSVVSMERQSQVKSFQEHLYDIIHENPEESSASGRMSNNTYDTLDFHRPNMSLMGHYQSTKTLKTFSSQDQEDYLCPIQLSQIEINFDS